MLGGRATDLDRSANSPLNCRIAATTVARPRADTLSRDAGPGRHQLRARRRAPRSAGRWVRDQIDEVRRRGVEVERVQLPARAAASTCRRPGGCARCCGASASTSSTPTTGCAGWCARLAGARPLVVTFHGTDVRHRVVGPLSRRLAWRVDLVAARLAGAVRARGRPARACRRVPGSAVLPCGPDLEPLPARCPRAEARRAARARPRRPLPASSPPTRRGRRSATTAPPSWPRPAAPSC